MHGYYHPKVIASQETIGHFNTGSISLAGLWQPHAGFPKGTELIKPWPRPSGKRCGWKQGTHLRSMPNRKHFIFPKPRTIASRILSTQKSQPLEIKHLTWEPCTSIKAYIKETRHNRREGGEHFKWHHNDSVRYIVLSWCSYSTDPICCQTATVGIVQHHWRPLLTAAHAAEPAKCYFPKHPFPLPTGQTLLDRSSFYQVCAQKCSHTHLMPSNHLIKTYASQI